MLEDDIGSEFVLTEVGALRSANMITLFPTNDLIIEGAILDVMPDEVLAKLQAAYPDGDGHLAINEVEQTESKAWYLGNDLQILVNLGDTNGNGVRFEMSAPLD